LFLTGGVNLLDLMSLVMKGANLDE